MGAVDPRTREEILEHYEIEQALANRLRGASKSERTGLYTALYDELFRRVPHHPQIAHPMPYQRREKLAERQAGFLNRIARNPIFLEIGAGDCLVSLAMCKYARSVFAVDVSAEIAPQQTPPNFSHVLSDGRSIDVAEAVTLAFSNQLMEHLHPEDALEQLQNIWRVLAAGGKYFCITPNRLSGPHDVSRHFDDEATGFHLKEYTARELSELLRSAGFRSVRYYAGVDGLYMPIPLIVVQITEWIVSRVPARFRRNAGQFPPIRLLLGLRILAQK